VELRERSGFRPVGNFLDWVSGNPRSGVPETTDDGIGS
jgi:hypothetical protein